MVRAGHQDAGLGLLDDVGGDYVGAGHFVEDCRGHVDELGGQDLGVDDALVELDAGLPVVVSNTAACTVWLMSMRSPAS